MNVQDPVFDGLATGHLLVSLMICTDRIPQKGQKRAGYPITPAGNPALKEERNAILLVHNYQLPEIQDIADYTGDSLELSRAAAAMDGDVIVFCGVDFMAETAAILSPNKTVLLPAGDACCPMAQMVTAGELKLAKERHPDAAVVCYVNTTAEVKAESDICCTSANAVKVVNAVEQDEVLFVPAEPRHVHPAVHEKDGPPVGRVLYRARRITPAQVQEARKAHPGAVVLVHPSPAGSDRLRGSRCKHLRDHPRGVLLRLPGIHHRYRSRHPPQAKKGVPGQTVLSALR